MSKVARQKTHVFEEGSNLLGSNFAPIQSLC